MEVNKNALGFLMVLIVGMIFSVGYFLSKSGSGQIAGATTEPSTQTQQAPSQPQISIEMIRGLFSKNLIKFGDVSNKLLLVEVSDPSCPYCHVAGGTNKEISRQMGKQFVYATDGGAYVPPVPEIKKLVDQGKAGFVWIYSPGHGAGEMATKAFYCAFEMGKFWQVHDKLMTNQAYSLINNQIKNDKTKSGELTKYLAGVIDQTEMKKCLDSGKYDSRIAEDTTQATALGVQGTPGFFVNSTKFAGAYSWTEMKVIADQVLK